jgi:PKD repeat protein
MSAKLDRLSVYSLFLAIFVCALAAHAGAAETLDYIIAGDLRFITDDNMARWNLDIDGGKLIWVEGKNSQAQQTIYYYNLLSGKKLLVTKTQYSDVDPALSGNYVLWGERSSYQSPSQINGYFMITRQKGTIDPYPANQGSPDYAGGYAVWLDSRYGGFINIMMKDTKTGKSYLFYQSGTSDKLSPTISGGYVYWVEKGNLYRMAISNPRGTPQLIAKGVPGDYSVADNKAVWETKTAGGYYKVVMHDLESGKTVDITDGSYDCRHPCVSGSIIVYESYVSGDSDVWIYDLYTGISASACRTGGDQISPKISCERIVWIDQTNGRSNIAYFRINSVAAPKAGFSATASSVLDGLAPLSVTFRGISSISPGTATNYVWDFGDGSTSTEGAPTHTYLKPGVYTVTLTVSNRFGNDVSVIKDYVTVGELPTVTFTCENTLGAIPFVTRFHSTITGSYDKHLWNFGDGVGSVLKDPYHNYIRAGTYDVSLTAYSKYGEVVEYRKDYIEVGGKPESAFVYAYAAESTAKNPVVRFTSTTTGSPTEYLWYFGDGEFSTEGNPVHRFKAPGIYDVSLKTVNRYGSDIHTEWGLVIDDDSTSFVLTDMMITPDRVGALVGDTVQFVASAKDSSGQNRLVFPEWSVTNPEVIEITQDGLMTAIGRGSSYITCRYGSLMAQATVIVGDEQFRNGTAAPALLMPHTDDNSEKSFIDEMLEKINIFNMFSGSED